MDFHDLRWATAYSIQGEALPFMFHRGAHRRLKSRRFTVMCRFDVIVFLLAQVSAIHDSDRHYRNGAHGAHAGEEVMRRDSPKARQARHEPENDLEQVLLEEAPKQAVRDRLSRAKELKDPIAFEEALKEGEQIGLDLSELDAFKDSFDEPMGGHEFRAEALIQDADDQPWGSYSQSSYGAPAGPVSSYANAFGPVASSAPAVSAASEDKDDKDGKSEEDKKMDFTHIDYIGCIIPQWTDGDWICAEAADVPDTQIYDDSQSRTRKKLREGDVCSVTCPDPRYWQKPEPAALVCKSGKWRDEVTRINVKKIQCETAGRWVFMLGTLMISLPLCCGCCAVCAFFRVRKKDRAPEPAASAAEQPSAEAGS
eukprot:s2891_g12.t2